MYAVLCLTDIFVSSSVMPVVVGDCFVCVFFFFQAEDGIRDWSVTGVQTCALPILPVVVKSCWI